MIPQISDSRFAMPDFTTGARPVPGRSSHDSAEALKYFDDAHHHRTRCAPGRRALRSGRQLCRPVNGNLKIGHRSSVIENRWFHRFQIQDSRCPISRFPTGARPVPGRSSHDSAEALKYFDDAHHHRTRCAPGRRALRSGRQLCRPAPRTAGAYLDNPHPVIIRSAFAFTASVAGVVPINSPSSCRSI